MTSITTLSDRLRDRFAGGPAAPDSPPCPTLDAGETCAGAWHLVETPEGPAAARRCPAAEATRVRARFGAEVERLGGAIDRCRGARLSGYDPARCAGGRWAQAAVRAFAAARPPEQSVVLLGSTGLGKTHLLLAAHLELLRAGIASEYLTGMDLAALLRQADSFDPEAADPALQALDRLRRAPALILDDIGEPAEDEPRRKGYVLGLKKLLHTAEGVWAAALNPEEEQALGPKLVSRLVEGAAVVTLEGADQRVAGGRR